MKSFICPQCDAGLVEDTWDDLRGTEEDGVVLERYHAYVCGKRCGYAKRMRPVPEVIAQQGNNRLLLSYPDEQGRILDVQRQVVGPLMNVYLILVKGYWDAYTGNHGIETLLENAHADLTGIVEAPRLFKFATGE